MVVRSARFGLFSTHPDTGSRIGRVEGYIQTAGIKLQVVINGNTAQIIDGSWQLPPITTAYGGYQPLYRAYFVAGKLYDLARSPGFDNQRFKPEAADDGQGVLYDDTVIITISPEEAKNSGLAPQGLAEQYAERLHQWKP